MAIHDGFHFTAKTSKNIKQLSSFDEMYPTKQTNKQTNKQTKAELYYLARIFLTMFR